MIKRREESIETIRGIALILMVAAHVVGSGNWDGMRLDENSLGRYIYKSLIHIRMPLFTVISGYVYSMKPVSVNLGFLKFIKAKSARILLPLLTVSTVQFVFQCYAPGVNSNFEISGIWRIYFFSYSHFWFLQAIFLVFIIVGIVDYFNLMASIHQWLVALFISFFLFLTIEIGDFFSINDVFYLLVFFIMGSGIRRFENIYFTNKTFISFITIILIICISIQQLQIFGLFNVEVHRRSLLGLIIGLCSTFLIIKLRFKHKMLSYIGYYSYGTFLWHLFGTASSRIFLGFLDLQQFKLFIFFISLVFGIIVPICMELIIIKNRFARLIFLGVK